MSPAIPWIRENGPRYIRAHRRVAFEHRSGRETVRLALRGELTTLMDYKLACEYRDVALRAEQLRGSGKSRVETAAILDALEAIAEPVFVAFQYRPLSPDASDDMVLDVAINGNADAIVTTIRSIFVKQQSVFTWKC